MFFSFSLSLTKRDRQLQGLSTLLPTITDQAAPYIRYLCKSSFNLQPPLYLKIKLDLVQFLPPACVHLSIQTKHFGFETMVYFSSWKTLFATRCFFIFIFSFSSDLWLCLLSTSSCTPGQSFKDSFHSFSSLGYHTSNFFKDSVFISVSSSPSFQG